MCLHLREKSHDPYNNSKIRYKILIKNSKSKKLESPYRYKNYTIGRWHKATGDKFRPAEFGIHVYVSKREAKTAPPRMSEHRFEKSAVFEVHCSGFLRSGKFCGRKCETWERVKVIKEVNLTPPAITEKGKRKV